MEVNCCNNNIKFQLQMVTGRWSKMNLILGCVRNSSTRSFQFPLVVLYSHQYESYTNANSPRLLCRFEILIPVRNLIPVSCKHGVTIRFTFFEF